MTPQEIQKTLREALDSLSQISESKAFDTMLNNSSFAMMMDKSDMDCIIRLFEVMLSGVNEYVSRAKSYDS